MGGIKLFALVYGSTLPRKLDEAMSGTQVLLVVLLLSPFLLYSANSRHGEINQLPNTCNFHRDHYDGVYIMLM